MLIDNGISWTRARGLTGLNYITVGLQAVVSDVLRLFTDDVDNSCSLTNTAALYTTYSTTADCVTRSQITQLIRTRANRPLVLRRHDVTRCCC